MVTFDRHKPSVEGFTRKPTIHRAGKATFTNITSPVSQTGTWWTTTSNLLSSTGLTTFLGDYGLGHNAIRLVTSGGYSYFELDPGYYQLVFQLELVSLSTLAVPEIAIVKRTPSTGAINAVPLFLTQYGVDSATNKGTYFNEMVVVDSQPEAELGLQVAVGVVSSGSGSFNTSSAELLIIKLGDRDG